MKKKEFALNLENLFFLSLNLLKVRFIVWKMFDELCYLKYEIPTIFLSLFNLHRVYFRR